MSEREARVTQPTTDPRKDPWYPGGQRDASLWVEEFFRIYPNGCDDADTMLGWFANAIETGVMFGTREARSDRPPEPPSLDLDLWAQIEYEFDTEITSFESARSWTALIAAEYARRLGSSPPPEPPTLDLMRALIHEARDMVPAKHRADLADYLVRALGASPPPPDLSGLLEAHTPWAKAIFASGHLWLACSCGWRMRDRTEDGDTSWNDHFRLASQPPSTPREPTE